MKGIILQSGGTDWCPYTSFCPEWWEL